MNTERDRGGDNRNQNESRESGQPGGGVGRREEVRGSGVHPASGGQAPDGAATRTPGEWGEGAGGEEGGRSELHIADTELGSDTPEDRQGS